MCSSTAQSVVVRSVLSGTIGMYKPQSPVVPDDDKYRMQDDVQYSIKVAAVHERSCPGCKCKDCVVARVHQRTNQQVESAQLESNQFSFQVAKDQAPPAKAPAVFPAARRRSSVSSRPSAITATKNELKFPQIKPNVAAVGFGGLDPEPSRAAPALEYWSLLGLQSGATNNEIKKAYLKLAAEFHPDKFVLYDEEDQLASAAKFAQIGEVYRVLKDETLRRVYESGGADAVQMYESNEAQLQHGVERSRSRSGSRSRVS